jgi:hypothetical protein
MTRAELASVVRRREGPVSSSLRQIVEGSAKRRAPGKSNMRRVESGLGGRQAYVHKLQVRSQRRSQSHRRFEDNGIGLTAADRYEYGLHG